MNKNFEELLDYIFLTNQDIIFNDIKKLFQKINEKNFEVFGNSLRKIIENIFNNIPNKTYEGDLNNKIYQLIEKEYVPLNVKNSIYHMKNIGNRESHGPKRKSDYHFVLSLDENEAKTLLRELWLFLKWIAINFSEINELEKINYKIEKHSFKEFQKKEYSNMNNDLNIEKLTIAQLIFNKKYKFNIPSYQRDYTWDKKNISKLFKDLLISSQESKTHFLGTLAIAIDKKDKILKIIDGQQRITTFLLFLKAFYKVMKNKGIKIDGSLEQLMKRISNIYINQDILSSQKSISLILNGEEEESNSNKGPWKVYKFIEQQLKENDDKIEELFSTFVSKMEVCILFFKTTLENEMDIFENLNTGGAKLEKWDLIRSYIFSKVETTTFQENELRINKKLNDSILVPINSITNNKSKAFIDNFLITYNRYFFIKKLKEASNDTYEDFKEIWIKNKMNNFKEFQNEMKKINYILNIYISLKKEFSNNSNSLHAYSHILNLFSSRTDVYPILIYSLEKYCNIDEFGQVKTINKNNEFIKVIRILESYIIRSNVYGENFRKQFDDYLIDIIKNKKDISETLFSFLKNNMPIPYGTLDEFKNLLISSGDLKPAIIMSIITHLELKLRKVKLDSSGFSRFEKTHEHIIPQKLKYHNYEQDNSKKINEKELNDLLSSKKNSIGNALLLSRGDNSKAGNKSFSEKLKIYKDSSSLSKGTKNGEIMDLNKKPSFTFVDVDKRSKQIAKYVIDQNIYYDE